MTAFLLFLAGLGAFLFAWLKKIAGQTAALDAAERAVEAAKAKVESTAAAVESAQTAAQATKESVSERLSKLEEIDAADRERDTIDVANEIIRRN